MHNIARLKRLVIEHLLIEHSNVFVTFDHHHPTAKSPPAYDDSDVLTLLWGMNLPNPIRDIRTDDHGLHGTLAFNRSSFFCFVPWDSVICISLAEGEQPSVAFQVPPELFSRLKGERPPENPRMISSRRRPPKLQLVRDDPDDGPKSA